MRSPIFLLVLVALVALAGTAAAEDAPSAEAPSGATVPDVTGKTEREAVAALEAAGFHAEVVTVAGTCPRLIADQWPKGGAAYEPGGVVRVKLCIAATVQTQAPDVVGKHEHDVVGMLEPLYYLEREYVGGRDEEPGTIVEQVPEAGAELPYRGELVLRIAARAVRVPSVLGMHVDEAAVHLATEGLEVKTFTMPESEDEAGTVVSQMPGASADALPGSVITLGVAGSPDDFASPDDTVPVPELRGLDVKEAYAAALEVGFVPHTTLVDAPEPATDSAWRIIEQDPEPGTHLEPGGVISLGVLRPTAAEPTRRAPSLVGLTADQADGILRSVGLTPRVRAVPSPLPAGRVLAQSPSPGTELAVGGEVSYAVSRRAVSRAPALRMPDVRGRELLEVRLALLARGLQARVVYRIAPDAPLRRILAQAPRPGRAVPAGGRVSLAVPAESVVPPLRGLSLDEARRALQAEGLAARVEVEPGPGRHRIVAQSAAPNTRIARGSSIRLRVAPEVPEALVRVPMVTGLRVSQAARELEAVGLVPKPIGSPFGAGERRVVAQGPNSGVRVPRGTQVLVRFEWAGGVATRPPHGRRVRVPALGGKTLGEAEALLRQRGLLLHPSGPRRGDGQRIVYAQDPAPGTRVGRGASVKAAYRYKGAPHDHHAPRVGVPHVVGKSLQEAQRVLRSRGLRARVLGAAAADRPVVVAQEPDARTRLAKGGTVTVKVEARPRREPSRVAVPRVVGLSAAKAKAELTGRGLRVRLVPSGHGGTTVLQQGHAGEHVARGTVIPLLVGSKHEGKGHDKGKRKSKRPRKSR